MIMSVIIHAKCTVDSAKWKAQLWYLIQSSQDPLTVSGETERDRMHQVWVNRDATPMMQSG